MLRKTLMKTGKQILITPQENIAYGTKRYANLLWRVVVWREFSWRMCAYVTWEGVSGARLDPSPISSPTNRPYCWQCCLLFTVTRCKYTCCFTSWALSCSSVLCYVYTFADYRISGKLHQWYNADLLFRNLIFRLCA